MFVFLYYNSKITDKMREIIDYGDLQGATIVKIFGDEMTYNDLKSYAYSETQTWNLKVERIENKEKDSQLIAVYFDDNKVFEKTYFMHYSCDMFYYLSELKINYDECGMNDESNKK